MNDDRNGDGLPPEPEGLRYPMPSPEPLALTERRICGAKKRNGEPCTQKPMRNGRCRMHGGKSLAGAAHPNFRTGKRSRYFKSVPAAMRDGYKAALNDPDLLSMGAEIALLTTRTSALLDRLSTSEAPPWDAAVALAGKLATIISEYEMPEAEQAAQLLVEVVNDGQTKTAANEATWTELRALIQERAKVAAVEHKREVDLETLIPADKALMLLSAMTAAAREIVTDRDQYRRLNARLLEMVPAD
jgi:hypothetical protein